MAKRKKQKVVIPEYRPGDLDEMAPPNRRLPNGPGSIAGLKKPDGTNAFVHETDARGGELTFNVTRIDPFLLEELLDADSRVRKLGIRADTHGKWTPAMMAAMRKEVERVFEEEYMPRVFAEFEEIADLLAEYTLLRQAGNLETMRLQEAIRAHRPKR